MKPILIISYSLLDIFIGRESYVFTSGYALFVSFGVIHSASAAVRAFTDI